MVVSETQNMYFLGFFFFFLAQHKIQCTLTILEPYGVHRINHYKRSGTMLAECSQKWKRLYTKAINVILLQYIQDRPRVSDNYHYDTFLMKVIRYLKRSIYAMYFNMFIHVQLTPQNIIGALFVKYIHQFSVFSNGTPLFFF